MFCFGCRHMDVGAAIPNLLSLPPPKNFNKPSFNSSHFTICTAAASKLCPPKYSLVSEKLWLLHVCLDVLVVALAERWTRDRKVTGSTPGRGAVKSPRSTQPSIPLG